MSTPDPFAPPSPSAMPLPALAAALAQARPGLWEGLEAAAGSGFWRTLLGQAASGGPLVEAYTTASEAELAPIDEATWRAGPYVRPGLAFDPRMTTARARAMADTFDANRAREVILGRRAEVAGPGERTLQFGAAVLGSLPTPENFIPFFGPGLRLAEAGYIGAGAARLAGRVSTWQGGRAFVPRVAVGAGAGAVDAGLGTLATAPLVDIARARAGDSDIGFQSLLEDMAWGAAAGFVLGGLLRVRTPAAHRLPAPDAVQQRTALGALATGADQVAQGKPLDISAHPAVRAETEALAQAYDQVLNQPRGPTDSPLVELQPEDIGRVLVERGPLREAPDGGIQVQWKGQRGYGLVKVLWRHGEQSGKAPENRITRDDVLALPEILRAHEPSAGSAERGMEWRIDRPGENGASRQVVYALSPLGDGSAQRLVTMYVQEPGRPGAGTPSSPLRTEGGKAGGGPANSGEPSAGMPGAPLSIGDSPGRPAGTIAPRAPDFTSPPDAPHAPPTVPRETADRAADLGAGAEQVEADATHAATLAAADRLPPELRAMLDASAEVAATVADSRAAFDAAAACVLGRI